MFAGEAEGACEGILQKAQAAVKQQLLQTLSLNTQKSFYKASGGARAHGSGVGAVVAHGIPGYT